MFYEDMSVRELYAEKREIRLQLQDAQGREQDELIEALQRVNEELNIRQGRNLDLVRY